MKLSAEAHESFSSVNTSTSLMLMLAGSLEREKAPYDKKPMGCG